MAYAQVQHIDAALGGSLVNAVVAIDTATGAVRKTADGDAYFSFAEKLGTTSTDLAETVYKVQYYTPGPDADTTARRRAEESPGGGGGMEQWHGNGMLRFQTKAGVKLLAFTHRFDAEAIILKVRKAPSWPRSWANSSPLSLYSRAGMRGP